VEKANPGMIGGSFLAARPDHYREAETPWGAWLGMTDVIVRHDNLALPDRQR
jgi:hypothetical protein